MEKKCNERKMSQGMGDVDELQDFALREWITMCPWMRGDE